MYLSIIAVGLGGGLGSLLRWVLGLRLNAIFPNLPLGTFDRALAKLAGAERV